MATYTYTTTPGEDEVILWLLAAAQLKSPDLTANDLIAGISHAHLQDWMRVKATSDAASALGVISAAQDAIRHTLSPSERAAFGV